VIPTTSWRARLGSPVAVRSEDFCFILAWRRELRRVEFFPSIKAFAVVVRLALEARLKAHAKPPPNRFGQLRAFGDLTRSAGELGSPGRSVSFELPVTLHKPNRVRALLTAWLTREGEPAPAG
jgi:hypothetical protein